MRSNMKIKKYSEFIRENNYRFLDTLDGMSSISNAVKGIDLSSDDSIIEICENLFYSDLITEDDRIEIQKYLTNQTLSQIINENFFDKLKDRFDKAKEVASGISDKAKSALETIVKSAKDIVSFIGDLKNKLLNSIKDILTNTVNKVKSKLKGDKKFSSETERVHSSNKEGLIKDLKTAKEVVDFHKTKMSNSLWEKMSTTLKNFFSKEDQPAIAEKLEILKEGHNNVISKLVDGLAHVPPFSWLHEVQKMGEKGANSIIGAISKFTHNLGGPAFTLPAIASLLGIAFEYNIKGLAKSGLLNVAGYFTIPFITIIISIVAWIATFIAAVDAIHEITGAPHGTEHRDGGDQTQHNKPENTRGSKKII